MVVNHIGKKCEMKNMSSAFEVKKNMSSALEVKKNLSSALERKNGTWSRSQLFCRSTASAGRLL